MRHESRVPDVDFIRDIPTWICIAIGVVVCGVIAYYIGELVLIICGQPMIYVANPTHLAAILLFLVIYSLIGLLFRRVFLVGIIIGIVGAAFGTWSALHGAGPAIGWIRNILANALWPIVNGFMLSRYVDFIKRVKAY